MRVNSFTFKLVGVALAALVVTGCAKKAPAPETTTAPAPAPAPAAPVSKIVPGSQEDLVQNVGDRVFFGFDKYDLTPEAQAQVQKQADWLQKYPSVKISIEGHCDERGTREYNLALGDRRANAVKSALVALGVSGDRLSTISYGKERPEATGHDESAWSLNRRGVLVVQ